MQYFKKILHFAYPYSKYAYLNIFFNLIYAVFSALSFLALIPMLDVLFNTTEYVDTPPKYVGISDAKNFIKNYVNYHVSQVVLENPVKALFITISIILSLFFIKNISNYLALYYITFLRNGVLKDLRDNIYENLINQPINYYSNRKKGDILSRLSSDVIEIQNSFLSILELLIRDPLTIIFTILIMFSISIELTIFVITFIPISGLIISWIGKVLKKISLKVQNEQGKFLTIIDETLSGLTIIKIFKAEKIFISKFKKSTSFFFKYSNRLVNRQNLASPLSEFLGIIVIGGLLWYGGKMVLIDETLNATTFISFMALAYNILTPAKSISKSFYNIKRGDAAADRVLKILDLKKSFEFTGKDDSVIFKKDIVFKNINFSYSNLPVIKNFSLKINKGESVAFVGESGSGKSTIINLLAKFFKLQNGDILIDNKSIKELSSNSIRSIISIVTQESILFNDTVKNNLLLGNENVSDEKLIDACKIAYINKVIEGLPDKYQTIVGERGNNLSGGQKQRLTIARALLKNAPVLIFDEATSSLDTKSEKKIQDSLVKFMRKKTSIIIAHRISTVKKVDKIVVMKNGEINGVGSHESLIKSNKHYKILFESQGI